MILFLGSVQLVPAIALMFFAVAGALVLAAWSAIFTPAAGAPAVTVAALSVLVATCAIAELLARWLSRRAAARLDHPRWGGKAAGLVLLRQCGLATPPWVGVDADSCAAIAAGSGRLSRDVRRFLERQAGHRIIVRSSFPGEDGAHSWAGVFATVADLDPADHAAILAALRTVAASGDATAARSYAARLGLDLPRAAAAILQRQVSWRVLGTAMSRGIDGREDHITLDERPRGGEARTLSYDLLTDAPTDTPAARWHRAVADASLATEIALGQPTQIEYAVDDADTVWLLQCRAIALPVRRQTWVNGGAIEMRSLGSSPEQRELRGGVERLAELLSASSPTGTAVAPSELRVVDDVPYLAASALRRLRVAAGTVGARRLAAALIGRPPSARSYPEAAETQARVTGWIAILDGLAGRLRADTLDDLPQPAWSLTAGLAGWIRRRRTALTQLRDRLHEQLVALEASVATPEEQAPHPARVHSPPLVTTPPSTPGMLVGQGLVGGRAVGVGAPPPLPAGDDALVLIARDGDPALTPELLRARALVLLGGGALSHLATTALELGLPTVLCPGAEPAWPAETSLEVDGDLGVVRPVNP